MRNDGAAGFAECRDGPVQFLGVRRRHAEFVGTDEHACDALVARGAIQQADDIDDGGGLGESEG